MENPFYKRLRDRSAQLEGWNDFDEQDQKYILDKLFEAAPLEKKAEFVPDPGTVRPGVVGEPTLLDRGFTFTPDVELEKSLPRREAERTGILLGAGATGFAEGLAGAGEWLFDSSTFKTIREGLGKFKEDILPDDEITFSDEVIMGSGSMIPNLAIAWVPGMGVRVGASALARYIPAYAKALGFVGDVSPTVAASIGEAFAEAGPVYAEQLQKTGGNKDEASARATDSFWMNLPAIVLTNRYGIFSKAKGLQKVFPSASQEGLQELWQGVVQRVNTDEEIKVKDLLREFGVGAIVGGGVAVAAGTPVATRKIADVIKSFPVNKTEMSRLANQMAVPNDGAFERFVEQPAVEKKLKKEEQAAAMDDAFAAKQQRNIAKEELEQEAKLRKEEGRKRGVAELKKELGNLYAKDEPATDEEFRKARQLPEKEELVDDFEFVSVFSRISDTGKQFWRIEPKSSKGKIIAKKLGAVEKPSGLWVKEDPLEAVAEMSRKLEVKKVSEPERGSTPLQKEEFVGPPPPPTDIEEQNKRDATSWLSKQMTLLDADIKGTKRFEGIKATTKLSEVKAREARLRGVKALRAELGNLYATPERLTPETVEAFSERMRDLKVEPQITKEGKARNIEMAVAPVTRGRVQIEKEVEKPSRKITPVEGYRGRVELLEDNIKTQPERFVENRLQAMEEAQNAGKEEIYEERLPERREDDDERKRDAADEIQEEVAAEPREEVPPPPSLGEMEETLPEEEIPAQKTEPSGKTQVREEQAKFEIPSVEQITKELSENKVADYQYATVTDLAYQGYEVRKKTKQITTIMKKGADGKTDSVVDEVSYIPVNEKPKKYDTTEKAAKAAQKWIAMSDPSVTVSVKGKKTKVEKSKDVIGAILGSVVKDKKRTNLLGVFSDAKNKKHVATDGKSLVAINDDSIETDKRTFSDGRVETEDLSFPDYMLLLEEKYETIYEKPISTSDLYSKILPLKGTPIAPVFGGSFYNPDRLLQTLKSLIQAGINEVSVKTTDTGKLLFKGDGGLGLVMGLSGGVTEDVKYIRIVDENGLVGPDENADYILSTGLGGLQTVFDSFKSKGGVEGAYTSIENMWRFHQPFFRYWSPIAADDVGVIFKWVQDMRDRIRSMKRRYDRLVRDGGKDAQQRAAEIEFRLNLFDRAFQSSVVRDNTRESLNSVAANALLPLARLKKDIRLSVERAIIEADLANSPLEESRIDALGEEAAGAYRSTRVVLDEVIPGQIYEHIREHFGFDPERAEAEVQKVKVRFDHYKGWYFPHTFGEGDYSVWATAKQYIKNEEGINVPIKSITLWHDRALTKAGAEAKHKQLAAWLKSDGVPQMGNRLNFDPKSFTIESGFGEDAKLNDATYIAANQKDVIDILRSSGIDQDSIEKVIESTMNTYLKRAFGRHFIGRKGVPGFYGDPLREDIYKEGRKDISDILHSHAFSAMGFITKGAQGVKFSKILSEIPENQKGKKQLTIADVSKDYDYLKNWIIQQQTNSSSADRFWDNAKNIVSVLGIGFRLVTATINSIQPETMGLLVGLSKRRWSWSASNKKLLVPYIEKARTDVLLKNYTAEEQGVLENIFDLSQISKSTISESMNYSSGIGSKIYRGMLDTAAFAMTVTERLNRKTTYLAGYRLARKSGLSVEKATKEATEFNLDVNGDYSKRGKAAIDHINMLKMPLSLTSFTRNYLKTMKNAVVEGDFLAIGAHLAFILLVAGPAALPFFNAADDWWKKEEGEGLMTAFRRWLKQNGLSSEWASGTVGKLFGVDVGPNFSLFVPTDGKSLLGMAGAVWRKTDEFKKELKLGDEGRLLETFPAFPFVVHDVFKYLRELDEGKTSKRGKRDEFAPPASWVALLGARTTKQRVYQESQQSLFAAKAKAKEGKRPLLTRIARAFNSGDDGGFDEIIQEIIRYNEENMDRPERIITGEMIKNAISPERIDKKLFGSFSENIELQ